MDDVRIFGYLHSDVVHVDSELVPLHSDNVLNTFPLFHMGSSAADGECSRRKATCIDSISVGAKLATPRNIWMMLNGFIMRCKDRLNIFGFPDMWRCILLM